MTAKMVPMEHVWVVETGEYEQRFIFAVGDSASAAAAAVRAAYAPPYEVEWSADVEQIEDGWVRLTGTFQQVPGLSTAHKAHYDITRFEVFTEP